MRSGVSEFVVVVGGGTMGAGIAFVAARAGFDVEVIEADANARDGFTTRLQAAVERAGDPGIFKRVQLSAGISTRPNAVLAIEAVPEDLELKRSVFAQLATALPPTALLATNTSSLSVGEIAENVPSPERIVGLHFFNPPAAMQLVEIVHMTQTSAETLARAEEFVKRLGKTAIRTADTPGFVVNRVARPYYLQALRALQEKLASAEELDELARGIGFRMGPFELMDLIGLDVNLATSQAIYERTGEDRLEPVDLQYAMVGEGLFGRKSGAGFYDYRQGVPPHADTSPPQAEKNESERLIVTGYGPLADEIAESLATHYLNFSRIQNDDTLEDIPEDTTIVVDAGDGINDRTTLLRTLDRILPPETVLFADAYATNVSECAKALAHSERLVGYGIVGSLERQKVVEIVGSSNVGDDALELAQELFAAAGKRVVLVEAGPGLFLGRVVASIVNEAVIAVRDGIASADDVDLAMRLGTNYPLGPIEWGREIGGGRVRRILEGVAAGEGDCFAPDRALWALDADVPEQPELQPATTPYDG